MAAGLVSQIIEATGRAKRDGPPKFGSLNRPAGLTPSQKAFAAQSCRRRRFSQKEDEWLRRASDAAIAGARKVALGNGPPELPASLAMA
jgi:hypothetical protein